MLLGAGASKKTYMEDVFSTYLYRGNDTSNTDITNGIDLAGEGGFVWIKNRDDGSYGHAAFDTVRGVGKMMRTNTNGAEANETNTVTTFNSNGFRINSDNNVNKDDDDFVSWTFRKSKGFFDICSWTGGDETYKNISHNLGSVPGCIIVKKYDGGSGDWFVWHKRLNNGTTSSEWRLALNEDWVEGSSGNSFLYGAPTATQFQVGDWFTNDGADYIAYVFAGGESNAATARSVGFNGVNTYLSIPDSTDFNLGTNSFTIEGWIYPNTGSMTSGHYGMICGQTSSNWYISIRGGSGLNSIQYSDGTSAHNSAADSIPEGQWTHVAFVNNSGTGTWYINGVPSNSGDAVSAPNVPNSSGAFEIGRHNSSNYFNGDLSNFRIVKGTAVYTSAFKPPTEPLTNITNTVLLCCNNSSTNGSTVTPGTITATGNEPARTYSPFDDPAGFKFGDSKEGIIKCGDYTGNGDATNGTKVYLGFEPQWVMIKPIDHSEHWHIFDNMRGMGTGVNDYRIEANQTGGDTTTVQFLNVNSDGFTALYDPNVNKNDHDFVYIAIRRPDGYVGKPADAGTDVFAMDTGAGSSTMPNFDSGFPVDWAITRAPASSTNWETGGRLIQGKWLETNSTNYESSAAYFDFDSHTGWMSGATAYNSNYQSWMWKRHAGFDVLTYEGNGALRSIPHSMGIAPEMMWFKKRNSSKNWYVYHSGLDGGNSPEDYSLRLNTTALEDEDGNTLWNQTVPTATHFRINTDSGVNADGDDYLALLFSSVSGISKVGRYTGNGSDTGPIITTGFVPRFLMIRRAGPTEGDNWNVLDTVRGLSSGADPLLKINNSNAHLTQYDLVDPTSDGFQLATTDSAHNSNNVNYVYYAHA